MATDPKAMVFVDGSNLLIEMFARLGKEGLRADRPSANAVQLANQILIEQAMSVMGRHQIVRSYWFGSVQGSEEFLHEVKQNLRAADFEAVLFHKTKGRDEKGVDLAIAREMLIHAFNKNYETAILVAGDEDYVGLVQDLKRLGVRVGGLFFEDKSLSPKLKISFDRFRPLEIPTARQAALVQAVKDES